MNTLIDIDHALFAFLNGSNSAFVDNLAIVLTSGLTWIPLYVALLLVVVKNNETMWQIMLVIGCTLLCVVLADGLADFIVKPLVGRYRPSNDPLIKYTVDVVKDMRGTGYSFFSAHAANTFCIAIFFSMLIRSYKFTVVLILWSLVNCWTRIYLGLHYPSDIVVGLLWGAVVGLSVYFVYLKAYLHTHPNFNYISSQFTSTGYNRTDIDIVLLVLILTLLYAMIKALIF